MKAKPDNPLNSNSSTKSSGSHGAGGTRLILRLDFANGERLGPGKIALLEQVGATGSISAAGRALGMSYKRAWELVDSLNRTFTAPVVETRHGGRRGGGAVLTAFGRTVPERYRAMEAAMRAGVAADLALVESELAASASPRPARPPGDDEL